jgi:hypothetical protein
MATKPEATLRVVNLSLTENQMQSNRKLEKKSEGFQKKVKAQSRAVIKRNLRAASWETVYQNLDDIASDIDTSAANRSIQPVSKILFK